MEQNLETLLLTEGWPEKRLVLIGRVAVVLKDCGSFLSFSGHCFGTDRKTGKSVGGHGSDEAVAVATLMRSCASIVSVIKSAAISDECYACAALLRQILEIEYLIYCFANRHKHAAEWLSATDKERQKFWQPRHMRKAADGHFDNEHYGWHCRIGGHPTAEANKVLNGGKALQQLLIADALMHSRGVWANFLEWSKLDADYARLWQVSFEKGADLSAKLDCWFENDPARVWDGWR